MKAFATILLLFSMCLSHSQDNVSIALYQDARLLFVGDDIGNEAPTTNVLLRFNLKCKQDEIGYGFVFPEIEYARLQGGEYFRYSLNGGYTFNQVIRKVEASITGGIGMIHRDNISNLSFGCSGSIGYRLGRVTPSVILQGTNRSDIGEFRFSTFIGLEYNF